MARLGIRKIQITMGTRRLTTMRFAGHGQTRYVITGLTVPTAGLDAGAHKLTVTVTDVSGRSASKTLRFSICVHRPIFTG